MTYIQLLHGLVQTVYVKVLQNLGDNPRQSGKNHSSLINSPKRQGKTNRKHLPAEPVKGLYSVVKFTDFR